MSPLQQHSNTEYVSAAVAGMGYVRAQVLGGTQRYVYYDMGIVDGGGHWRRTVKVAICHGYQNGMWYTAGSF